MKKILKPNRLLASKSFKSSDLTFPLKFCVERENNEWFLFGFEMNDFTGNQLFNLNIECEAEMVVEIGFKRIVNILNINEPSFNNTKNIQILETFKVEGEKNIKVFWIKQDLFNDYCIYTKIANNGVQNGLVTINNIEWENLD
ncbi:MAG: hypothetical protein QXR30_03875 [Candidatus Woesearchaeota archaeon]